MSYVGDFSGGSGSVLISGIGSAWVSDSDVEIGVGGTGTLSVENGGAMDNRYGYVGSFEGGTGVVTITGSGSRWTNAIDLLVGYSGSGTVAVLNGGNVFSGSSYIGAFDVGKGPVTVSGSGSIWANTNSIVVGQGGTGSLTLTERGSAMASNAVLGSFASANGTINLGAASTDPADAAVAGTLNAAMLAFGEGIGTLNFNHTDSAYLFAPALTSTAAGTHALNHYAGTTKLTADSSAFIGTTTVSGGTLQMANRLGGSATVNGGRLQMDGTFSGPVAVEAGGTLVGVGTIAGATTFSNGGTLEGIQGQTLTFGNDLFLDGASRINTTLGGADTPSLFDVGGALTLDGTLNVSSQGGFGQGIYRLFDYAGALTDNTLDIGATPGRVSAADLLFQTGSGQVNLIYTAGATLNFWDGADSALHNNNTVDGGDGIWTAADSNWTTVNGSVNGPFLPNPNFAMFQGTGGTNAQGQISITGLQIAIDGYSIVAGELALQGGAESIVRVGDSSAARASMVGTLASHLRGRANW